VSAVLRAARSGARLLAARARGAPLPYSVTFILTHRCNFRCAYCDIPDAAGDEMSTAEFCGAIDQLAEAGMARASFSGGEALLRPDAVDIIAHARKRGMVTSLNTNAWLTAQKLDVLAPLLDMLVVSLDAPDAAHDAVRRREGSLKRVLEVVKLARERNLPLATITVLGPWNLGRVEDILSLAAREKFWAYFQPAYSDCFAHEQGLHPSFAPAVFEDLAERLAAAKERGLPVGASTGYLERLKRGPSFGDCASCQAGRYFATVLPDGQVVPCHLVSRATRYPNGRALGFARAFFALPEHKRGPGCAISPYQESDLIFRLDPRAIADAVRRLGRAAWGAS
jgi:MoaA/NifB/PqqE/SkfB family radical SAM enzyme